jgi:predicted GIY-YIG superfamily endonuclease
VRPDPGRTALYRYIDSGGRLLYVGITGKPKERWQAHSRRPWATGATERTVEWFDRRTAALHAEKVAIQTEKPVYNRFYNFETVPSAFDGWPSLKDMGRQKFIRLADLIRGEIDAGKWLPGQRLPSPHILAAATDVSEGTVVRAIQKLRDERYVYTRRAFGVFISER